MRTGIDISSLCWSLHTFAPRTVTVSVHPIQAFCPPIRRQQSLTTLQSPLQIITSIARKSRKFFVTHNLRLCTPSLYRGSDDRRSKSVFSIKLYHYLLKEERIETNPASESEDISLWNVTVQVTGNISVIAYLVSVMIVIRQWIFSDLRRVISPAANSKKIYTVNCQSEFDYLSTTPTLHPRPLYVWRLWFTCENSARLYPKNFDLWRTCVSMRFVDKLIFHTIYCRRKKTRWHSTANRPLVLVCLRR